MSNKHKKSKSLLAKNIAAGAVLVVLSGFVPKLSRPAAAASAKISAKGTFVGGIKIGAGTDLLFKKMVATDTSGFASVTASGATTNTGTTKGKVIFLSGAQNGTFTFKAAAKSRVIDITAAGIDASTALGATASVPTPVGSVKVDQIYIKGPFAAQQTISKAGTSGLQTTTVNTNASTNLNVGGQVVWATGTTPPLGDFALPITLTVVY